MYMQRSGAGYIFRRAIPGSLQPVLQKREIKIPLGTDYKTACRRARHEAVRSDTLFDDAKAQLSRRNTKQGEFYQGLTPITELTDELKQQLHAYWLSVVDAADQERRATPKTADTAEEHEEFRSEAQSMLDTLKTAWRDGNVDPFLPALHTTLMVRGYRLELPLDDQRRLGLQFLRAALAGYKLLEARDAGEDPPLALPTQPLPLAETAKPSPPTKPKTTAGQITLHSLFEYWRDGATGRTQKTIDDVKRRIEEFDTLTQGKPADQLVKADLIAYRDARIKKGLALSTVEKDLSFLKTVLHFAFDSDKLSTNPAAGIKVPKDNMPGPKRDLDKEDLGKLFTSAIYTAGKRPQGGAGEAAAWLPLMALYTGARLEELCQLTLDDIKTAEPMPYLRILDLIDEEQDKQIKRLKNEGSRREIPIPKKLIAHGFLDYVEHLRSAQETWIFPHLAVDPKYGRRGANFSKWWGRWRNSLGVTGRHKCFHAFRHVFKTACREAGIGEDIHDAITGHSKGHEGRNYGKFPLRSLMPIDKVRYPDLESDWVWTAPTGTPRRPVKRRKKLATSTTPRTAKRKPKQAAKR